jgi:hypothetical protein
VDSHKESARVWGTALKAAIFTGSRHWLDRVAVTKAFDQLRPDVVIEGGADGLDTMARWECLERKITVFTYKAEWDKYGLAAGPTRNKKMLDRLLEYQEKGYEISVHAFPLSGGKGTPGMIKMAENAGVTVHKYRHRRKSDPVPRKRRK